MPDQDPDAKILQCQKCDRRLKYTGKKSVVSCPGCGESVPVVDNIQEVTDQLPWLNQEPQLTSIKKPRSSLLGFKGPIPMHIAIIYCIWVMWGIVVLVSALRGFTDYSQVVDGTVYTNQFGPRSLGLFICANLFASTVSAAIYAVLAAIPSFLIWNYFALKSNKS